MSTYQSHDLIIQPGVGSFVPVAYLLIIVYIMVGTFDESVAFTFCLILRLFF